MDPFRIAPDFYDASASQQLAVSAALLILLAVIVFIAVHMVRRGFRTPVASEGAKVAPDLRLRKYEIGARLYHWANALLLVLLAVSGIALFSPGTLPAAPWLLVHEISAGGFVGALLLHIVVAPRRGSGSAMWFEGRDWHDLKLIVRNFLGLTTAYPAVGKYDPLQKIYHALLTLASAAVIFSGVYLVTSAEVWATFTHAWLRNMRLVHDLGACAFAAVVVGHIYFGIIRVNWPQLISMITGNVRGSSFNRYHDATRWTPPASEDTIAVVTQRDRRSAPVSRAAD